MENSNPTIVNRVNEINAEINDLLQIKADLEHDLKEQGSDEPLRIHRRKCLENAKRRINKLRKEKLTICQPSLFHFDNVEVRLPEPY